MITILFALLAIPAMAGSADILVIGDSHATGCFGTSLYDQLETFRPIGSANNARVHLIATCGSSVLSWTKDHSTRCGFLDCAPGAPCTLKARFSTTGSTASLDSLLAKLNPRVTVVALGSNMLKWGWRNSQAQVAGLIATIHSRKSACLWIGPPTPGLQGSSCVAKGKYDEYIEKMKAFVEGLGCAFVHSGDYTESARVPASDPQCMHQGCKSATAWAAEAYRTEIQDVLHRFF